VYPIRGQLVIAKAPWIKKTMALVDEFIYMIPRMDGTVALGGTYESDRECDLHFF
jgi:hypothetical protein